MTDGLPAETAVLDGLLAGLDPDGWERPTPAVGRAIRDRAAHPAYFDDTCRRTLVDPDGFRAESEALQARGPGFPDLSAAEHLDTHLDVRGDVATAWLGIAQAFAGAPAGGRPPRRTPEVTS